MARHCCTGLDKLPLWTCEHVFRIYLNRLFNVSNAQGTKCHTMKLHFTFRSAFQAAISMSSEEKLRN